MRSLSIHSLPLLLSFQVTMIFKAIIISDRIGTMYWFEFHVIGKWLIRVILVFDLAQYSVIIT